MSQSKRLSSLINTAWQTDDKQLAVDTFKEYQVSHCYHPNHVRSFDAHTGTFRTIEVPCGNCYHCKETKINSWVTRMYAHCEDFKNVYFVTLTYRSFQDLSSTASKLILNKLSQAVWHKDNHNFNHHVSYNPCLLCKAHYQNFLKRLRKYTGISDLTYAVSGEYGKKFGRPHFHLILFTNSELSEESIKRAWSLVLFRHNKYGWQYKTSQSAENGTAFYFPIGHVDFHNLVHNGSFNTGVRVKVDGSFMNAANCFSYVCKYVCKQNSFTRKRLNLAYYSLWKKETFVRLYENEVQFKIARDYLIGLGSVYSLGITDEQLKQLSYEKIIPIIGENIYSESLVREKLHSFPANVEINEMLFPQNYFDFRDAFAPFVEFSRGTPIGSVYAKTHIQEFTQGVFNRPILQTGSFVVPNYFRDKAKKFFYGLRQIHPTKSGVSLSLGNLPNLYGLLSAFTAPVPERYLYSVTINSDSDINKIVKDSCKFVDSYTGEHLLFSTDLGIIRVDGYKYDRHSRSYYLTSSYPLNSWLHLWLDRLEEEFKRGFDQTTAALESQKHKELAALMLRDFGLEVTDLQQQFESEQINYLQRRDIIYNELHNSVE